MIVFSSRIGVILFVFLVYAFEPSVSILATEPEAIHMNNIDDNKRDGRQYTNTVTNPQSTKINDLHNIITGIFKLLNGSVKLKTNTIIEPDLSTKKPVNYSRINNRGPPLIFDNLVPTPTATLPSTDNTNDAAAIEIELLPSSVSTKITPTIGYQAASVQVPTVSSSLPSAFRTKEIAILTSSEPEVITTRPVTAHSPIMQSTTMISSLPPIRTNFVPKPGIVIDDPEYKQTVKHAIVEPQPGDIFDITVSAVQGLGGGGVSNIFDKGNLKNALKPAGFPGDVEKVHIDRNHEIITKPVEGQGFVSIDGKRTYLNLFGSDESSTITATKVISATKLIQKTADLPISGQATVIKKPNFNRKVPSPPIVRIDTCIVGDDSTCDQSQNEVCRVESNISSCSCRAGFSRSKPRESCRSSISILISIRVDRLYDRRILWVGDLRNEHSDLYQHLAYETPYAVESALSMTPFGTAFLKAKLNNMYRGNRAKGEEGIFANLTLHLVQSNETIQPSVKSSIQKHLIDVIQRRSNNIGLSGVWVNSTAGSVSNLQDVNECSDPELNDCHKLAKCINSFGTFTCRCNEGLRDQWFDNKFWSGRKCEQCSSAINCNNRGECRYRNGQPFCQCNSNYYGSQCEIDGEVLMVSIGACVAAVIIIILTLIFLIMWSRKWSREQKSILMGGSPVFNYMNTAATNTLKGPALGPGYGSPQLPTPYHINVDDFRARWPSYPDVLVQNNLYAPEPVMGMHHSRPASAIFGYQRPKLAQMYGTLPPNNPHNVTMPPIPLPRLALLQKQQQQQQHQHQKSMQHQHQYQKPKKPSSMQNFRQHLIENTPNHTSSDDEDRADLLKRTFNSSKNKSTLMSNNNLNSSIYYDVDYEQNEPQQRPKNMAMPFNGQSTHHPYTLSRPYYRN